METLVVVDQHRNQYYSRSKGHGPMRFGSFESPPSKNFRGINCRTFQSGAGLLPTPVKHCSSPVAKRASSPSFSPKTPLTSQNSGSGEPKNSKKSSKTSAIPIPIKLSVDVSTDKPRSLSDNFHFSERWAGPTYYNSPPPSSLPLPKFSLRPKRTVSLDLPSSVSEIDLHPIAKSAPASPTRQLSSSSDDFFDDGSREGSPSPDGFSDDSNDFATKTLRRILNLDLTDED